MSKNESCFKNLGSQFLYFPCQYRHTWWWQRHCPSFFFFKQYLLYVNIFYVMWLKFPIKIFQKSNKACKNSVCPSLSALFVFGGWNVVSRLHAYSRPIEGLSSFISANVLSPPPPILSALTHNYPPALPLPLFGAAVTSTLSLGVGGKALFPEASVLVELRW